MDHGYEQLEANEVHYDLLPELPGMDSNGVAATQGGTVYHIPGDMHTDQTPAHDAGYASHTSPLEHSVSPA